MKIPVAIFILNEGDGFEKFKFNDTLELKPDIFEEDDGHLFLCPFCDKLNYCIDAGITCSDYTTNIMKWESNECCKNLFVFDDENIIKMRYEDLERFYPDKALKIPKEDNVFYVAVNVLKIKKISNHQLYDYKIDNPLSDDLVKKFIQYQASSDKQLLKTFMKDYNISENNIDSIHELKQINKEKLFNLSLTVDNYILKLKIGDFDEFDYAHDGVIIALLCEDKNQKEITIFYWGD